MLFPGAPGGKLKFADMAEKLHAHLEPAPPIEIDYVIRTLSTLQHGRGSHSFTSLFNLSVFNGKGGARRDCVARVKGVLGGV